MERRRRATPGEAGSRRDADLDDADLDDADLDVDADREDDADLDDDVPVDADLEDADLDEDEPVDADGQEIIRVECEAGTLVGSMETVIDVDAFGGIAVHGAPGSGNFRWNDSSRRGCLRTGWRSR